MKKKLGEIYLCYVVAYMLKLLNKLKDVITSKLSKYLCFHKIVAIINV